MASKLIALAAVAVLLTACGGYYGNPVMPPTGQWFNNQGVPVDIEFEEGTQMLGNSKGASRSQSILGLVAWGDSSVKSAAEEGGIRNVDHVDARFYNILGVYSYYETVVTGN